MRTVDRRTGIEVINRDECLELLHADVIGRLGIAPHGSALVLPVNYAMDGDIVVFRTAPGSKLAAAERSPVCFEIDGFDRQARTGWSVVVTGRLEEVTASQSALRDRLDALGVSPWADGERDHLMRIVPTHISGRRVSGPTA